MDSIVDMKKLTKQEFIERSNLKHKNKYSYKKTVFKNTKIKTIITCPIHGDFTQPPSEHMRGYGCKRCADDSFKKTKKEFVEISNLKFKNKYDYSLVDYKNSYTKIKILCHKHGVFEQTPKNHIKSKGCPKCNLKNSKPTPIIKSKKEKFIIKANKLHTNKYDYSKIVYKNSKTKIDIICPKHHDFQQTPSVHLSKYGGCGKCKKEILEKNKLKLILEKFKKTHGDKYDYSEVTSVKSKCKVKIKCKTHGFFYQSIEKHSIGQGCVKCSYNRSGTRLSRCLYFVDKANIVHKNKYDYQKVKDDYINIHSKVCIICPIHKEFKQSLHNHIKHTQGCPKCSVSKGEIMIEEFLKKNNLVFSLQKKFDGCINPKTKHKLRFDFYLPTFNLCIEFDGEQHFVPMRFSDKDKAERKLKEIKYRDNIKNVFCKNNNIKLLRIDYKKINQINIILEKYLKINQIK